MTTPPLREAARVIALDDDQRVLLLHYDEGGSFFFSAPVKSPRAPVDAGDGQKYERLAVKRKAIAKM
jgi:hypothetical protein